jgi:AraC family transcriptional regulator
MREFRLQTQSFLAVAMIAAAASAWAQAPSAAAQASIRTANEELRAALQHRDPERLAQMYASDAQIVLPGQTIVGHEAILAHMQFAVGAGVRDFRIQDQELFGGEGFVVETGRTSFYDAAGTLMGVDRYMTLWRNVDGSWRVFRDMAVPEKTASQRGAAREAFHFAVKQVQPYSALVLPMTGSFSQISPAIARVAAARGDTPGGPAFTIYFNSPANVPESDLKWEAGFPVPSGTKASAPFEIREFPEQTVVFAVISGPYDAERPWGGLLDWAGQHGYEPSGPPMEIWMDGPKTEMRLPVRKRPS